MRLLLPLVLLAAAGCESAPENIPPKEAAFVTDDCALIAAIGREQYKLSKDDPNMRIRLNGEDAPWQPNCDWKAEGFNLVQVIGPEGEQATKGWDQVSFTRPHYDALGALVRTSITHGTDTVSGLCRVKHGDAGWSVQSCGPDPKLTQPRPAAPNITDATPDKGKIQLPADASPTARQLTIPDPDPGAHTGSSSPN